MEIEYQLSKKDYYNASKLYLKNSLLKRPWVFVVLIIILIMSLGGGSNEIWRFSFAVVASPVIVIAFMYFLPLFIISIRVNKALNQNQSGLEKKRLMVTDEGLIIESESKSQLRKWESIASVHSNDKFIYLILADKRISTIPKAAFPTESEAVNFLGLIQSRIIKIRGIAAFSDSTARSKPDYAIGLLCLIPLVGAFAGLIFIANGIFKYKDKWFVIIGIAGIVWTVAVYGSISYSATTPGFRKILAEQSQKQLNSAMKAVEFYKMKNGSYPDSLEQVNDDNSQTSLYDPLQSGGGVNKNNEFNYQKVGNHYYLFSSGLDGIPNTKDDLYPQVAAADSSKFGLIVKKPE
jgi:hypothetical protein